jgi:hypothetical protein
MPWQTIIVTKPGDAGAGIILMGAQSMASLGLLRTSRLVQCNVASSSSLGIALAAQCSLSCWRSQSISSRIRWQDSLASRRRSPGRSLVCFLNDTTNPHSLPSPHFADTALHNSRCASPPYYYRMEPAGPP